MRQKFTAALGTAALFTCLGFTAAPAASAATGAEFCGYTYSTSEPTLRSGSRGAAVTALQCQLNQDMSNTHLALDGVFGKQTYDAVVRFQGCAGIDRDGVVGPVTWHWLDLYADIDTEANHIC
ncbi:peptidoglycan-binding domain-containing protein [Streptomyces sp. NPDC089919]|uniref:peptidoglycan-binding domain-containing protein n=1 Tax=Streptomyces sp. NPDC089919 TaxID=3155188 RepID=UPI0034278FD0